MKKSTQKFIDSLTWFLLIILGIFVLYAFIFWLEDAMETGGAEGIFKIFLGFFALIFLIGPFIKRWKERGKQPAEREKISARNFLIFAISSTILIIWWAISHKNFWGLLVIILIWAFFLTLKIKE